MAEQELEPGLPCYGLVMSKEDRVVSAGVNLHYSHNNHVRYNSVCVCVSVCVAQSPCVSLKPSLKDQSPVL